MGIWDNITNTFQRQSRLTILIIVNVAVFLTLNLVGNLSHQSQLYTYLALPLSTSEFIFRFWTLFTYMFTHLDLTHALYNIILLFFSGQLFFSILGERRLVYVYVMSGLAGGLILLLLGMLMPETFANNILLGASASVMGIIMVMAIYTPNLPVYLFFMLEMKFKYFAILIFVLSTVIDFAANTGGKIAHIGGAAFGLLYGYSLKNGKDLFDFSFLTGSKKKLKVVHKKAPVTGSSAKQADDERHLNYLLDKISKSGYDSLTKQEKEDLFKLSQKK
jgi:membrane associated rhomboid family serine protease